MADWASWWLASVPGWGAVRLRQLIASMKNTENIIRNLKVSKDPVEFYEWLERGWTETQEAKSGERLKIKSKDIQQLWEHQKNYSKSREEYEYWMEQGIKFVTLTDAEYPLRLRQIYDPPFALYVRGYLPDENRKTAAVIGARACSGYGAVHGRKIARELALQGVQIISGLAYGVDSEGHLGALESEVMGATYAILGCGLDKCYPPEHEKLAEQILNHRGGLISEFPPGTEPIAAHFPMRNRIISGLSDCILVMEARRRSGSLITVDQALDQGREVFALPGRIGDKLSEGCIHLIRNGANVLTESGDVMQYLFGNKLKSGEECILPEEKLCESGFEVYERGEASIILEGKNSVYSCLDPVGKTVEEIMCLTGLPLEAVRTQLLDLLLEGQISETIKGYYSVT